MIQLYFLSIVCNGLAGYILFSGDEGQTDDKFNFSIKSPVFHLVLGILSIVTAVLKLLSPVISATGKSIFFFGDLIPAAAGLIAGLLLIFGIYRRDVSSGEDLTQVESKSSGSLDHFAMTLMLSRKVVGIALIAVAVVHFIFASLPLL